MAHEHAPNNADVVAGIIAEFSEVFAFSRTRWARYAEDLNSEVSGVGMIILQSIVRKGPITATGICQLLDMDKSLVSRQLAKLRDIGLVESSEAPEDRRVQLITATEKANDLITRIRDRWAKSYRERFAGWTEEELEVLSAGLHRFNAFTAETSTDGPAKRCARHASEGTPDA